MMNLEVVNTEELKKQVEADVKPADPQIAALQKQAIENVGSLMTLDISDLQEKRNLLKSIDQFGMDSLQASARKNSLLQVTVGKLAKGGADGSEVSNSLADLHREIKDLDPSVLDFTKEGFLGRIFNPVRRYFDKYVRADSVIKDVLVALDKGKQTLTNDNVTLEIEEDALRAVTKKLRAEIELGVIMDEQIVQAVERAKIAGEEEDKIRFVTEEVLFPLRQRIMDMQQMIVINHQGIIAMEVVRRNNKELIRGVDRAKTVTVTALRTAVMVASAMYNQKIVLQKIDLLNETTVNLISSTSQMLREQGVEIQTRATESSVSPEILKQAFSDALAALEDISVFKQQALPKMAELITQFRDLAETGEREVARLESAKE